MEYLRDPSLYWIPLGIISILTAGINLIRVLSHKSKNCESLIFLSLSSVIFLLVSEYILVGTWVEGGDLSALEDVAPSMSSILLRFAVLIVAVNWFTLFLYRRENR